MSGSNSRDIEAENGFVISDADWHRVVWKLGLSNRESEIMAHLLANRSESEIADAIGLAKTTVHTYVGRLYRRLRVNGRSVAVIAVMACYIKIRDSADTVQPVTDLISTESSK